MALSSNSVPPSAVFHRSFAKTYEKASSGEGIYIVKEDGSRILDGCCGAAVSCLGHGHPTVIEAIVEQTRKLAFAHTSVFTNDPQEELANLLIKESDGAFSKAMFLSSGSEAIESIIKIARQFHVSNREPKRVNFIGREFSYHGNTLGALSLGSNSQRRKAFEPMLSPAFHHAPRCFFEKDKMQGETGDQYVKRLIQEYEDLFQKLGPSTVAAIVIETMSGATLGAVPAISGYLHQLRELCNRHGALLIFDEVMCGMGRAGTMHAWQSLGGVAPDLQAIGKGLGAGYQPISGVLVAPKVHQVMESTATEHPFISGHTYQGHAIGCAAALATQKVILNNDLLKNVKAMGQLLERELRARTPMVKDIRGLGLFQAVEFSTPLGEPIAAKVASACLSNGAAVYLCSDAVDAILFAPPFVITEDEIKELVGIFLKSLKQAVEPLIERL